MSKFASGMGILVALVMIASNPRMAGAEPTTSFPDWADVKAVVEAHFSSLPGFQPNDLIVENDVAPVFRELERRGWKEVARSDTASRLVKDSEFLARELSSPPGKAFMRRVSGYTLIYDRLDRIAKMPGGQRLIHDMIRLPDGHRYAAMNPHAGTPSMVEFLPKGVSGKSPRVVDLDKPTGRVYTLQGLLEHLAATHRAAQKQPPAP